MPAPQNLTHQPAEAPFTSQGSQDLVKLLPIRGSFVSLSDLNIKYERQFIMSISLQMFFNHPLPNGMKLMAIRKIGVSAFKYNKPSKIQLIDASQAAKSLAQKTVLLISKKGASCVSFGYRLKLRELLRLVPWATEFEHHLAQNLGKAHLPKNMKSQSFPVESYEFTLSIFEQQKSVRVCCPVKTFMFNASSSKSNSSTSWGTLHFTRQPRSCEVAPDPRQFCFTFRP